MYTAKNFESLLGTPGFSDELLKNHFKLYEGYVVNTNKLQEILTSMVIEGNTNSPQYAEIKRRFGWEWNGMRLHELYFGNMTKSVGDSPDGSLEIIKEISTHFTSYENWVNDFKSSGAMRGIGWVVLYNDEDGKRLFNSWVNEHDLGHLSGCKPLLVMDVFEHAFILDYGLKRADYINAFLKSIDWNIVNDRFLGR